MALAPFVREKSREKSDAKWPRSQKVGQGKLGREGYTNYWMVGVKYSNVGGMLLISGRDDVNEDGEDDLIIVVCG